MPLIGSIVPIRNKLAYPAGVAPGFDQNHPAAQGISPGHGFSAVASNGNMINILNAARATIAGSPTASILNFGPSVKFPASAKNSFSGNSLVNDRVFTLAAIIFPTSTSTINGIISTSGAAGQGFEIYVTSGVLHSVVQNSTDLSSGLSLAANTPYFVAVSQNALITPTPANWVVLNLNNGILRTAAVSAALTNAPVAPNGAYVVGNDPAANAFLGYIFAAMFSPTFLSLRGLITWAADPWAFWYPQRPPSWVGIVAVASTFQAAWAINRNRVIEGVAT